MATDWTQDVIDPVGMKFGCSHSALIITLAIIPRPGVMIGTLSSSPSDGGSWVRYDKIYKSECRKNN